MTARSRGRFAACLLRMMSASDATSIGEPSMTISSAPIADAFERSYSIDRSHEVQLKAIVVANDAVQIGRGIVGPKHCGAERAGDPLQLRQVPAVLRNRKSKSIVVTGAPWSAAAALPMRTASSL